MTEPAGRLLSAMDAEKVLGIPAATVRSWFRRRERTGLWDFGRDQRNHPMFREADLRALRDKNMSRDQRAKNRKQAGRVSRFRVSS